MSDAVAFNKMKFSVAVLQRHCQDVAWYVTYISNPQIISFDTEALVVNQNYYKLHLR